ncbi:MAG: PD-(D/E)XK nuclease family protein, partial [Bacteroidia bacterium]|nr:PD-(D/E)XK nuclease family protein [Bacteroidia bacterium]
RIKEPEEISEDLDASAFGNVFHDSMEELYKNTEFTKEALGKLEKLAESTVDKQIELTLKVSGNKLEGKNILLREVIIELVKKVIQNDKAELPFKLISTEKKYFKKLKLNSGKTILLEGKIDRIDEKNGNTRIVDYKTGKAELLSGKKKIEDLFEDSKYKASMQLYFYATLLDQEIKDTTQLGVYKLQEVNSGVKVLNRPNILEDVAEYKARLESELNDLFDPDIPFEQTKEIKRCEYCPYKTICSR